MVENIVLKKATPNDSDEISVLARELFIEAYGSKMADHHLKKYVVEAFNPQK